MTLARLLLGAIQPEVVSSDQLTEAGERASDRLNAPSVLSAPDADAIAHWTPRIVRFVAQLMLD